MAEREPLHILVVMAHPHDFTHCAGTCGIHVSRGDAVTVVSMTNGIHAHNVRLHDELLKPETERDPEVFDQSEEEYAEEKAGEFRQVCALFGVEDVRILSFPEYPFFRKTPEAVEALTQIIYEVRPHVLITQSPYLTGPHGMAYGGQDSHKETAFAVIEAQILAATPNYETRQQPHSIAAAFYPGVYFQRDEIDFYVDITDWKEQRIQAEILFGTQGHTEAYARKRVEIGPGHMGWYSGAGYAEGFVRARPELLTEIRVSEADLRRASEPHRRQIERVSGEVRDRIE